MIYSRSAEYAIRAFVYMAGVPAGKYALVREIAAAASIPSHFLAKILQQLARHGMLRSSKGPGGGFSLRQPARDIPLLRIVAAVDGVGAEERCVAGMPECGDHVACGMHDSWKALRSRIMVYLERTSVEDVARALERKQRALDKPRRLPTLSRGRKGRRRVNVD